MSIAGMVVWALTAGIGIYLLAAGIAAQRAVTGTPRPAAPAPATAGQGPEPAGSGTGRPAEHAAAAGDAMLVGAAALAVVLGGDPAGGRPAVEGSPLLEFIHPALALLGLMFWICFVMTGDRVFAWIAFGVVVATVTAGLSWEMARRRKVRSRGSAERAAGGAGFPAHLVALHGLAAACTFALVVIAAVTASHG